MFDDWSVRYMSPASRLRARADMIRELGEITRRNWDPDPESWHHKVYTKWEQITGNHRERENFCHYWRVCVIWGPFAIVRQNIGNAYKHQWVQLGTAIFCALIALAALGWAISTFTDFFLGAALIFGTLGYAIFSLLTTFQVATEVLKDDEDGTPQRNPWPWLHKQEFGIKCLFAFFSTPMIVAITAIASVLIGIFGFLAWAFDDKDFGSILLNFMLEMHPPVRWLRWLRPWLIVPIGIGVAAYYSKTVLGYLEVLGIIAGIIAVIVTVVLGGGWVIDVLRRNRKVRDVQLTSEQPELYLDVTPTVCSEQPRQRRHPLRAIGNFLVFMWSYALTKKWKACPLVNTRPTPVPTTTD